MPENIGTVDICLMKDKNTARPFNVSVFVTEISSTGSSATGIYKYCCFVWKRYCKYCGILRIKVYRHSVHKYNVM